MRALGEESDDFSDADEQRIRDLLAAQPRPVMPADVAARLEAALAAEPRPVVVATAASGSSRRWWGVAAAAALVLLAGAIVVPQWQQQSTPVADTAMPVEQEAGPQIPPAAAAERISVDCVPEPLTYDTGTTYQQAALTTQAQALVPQECGGDAPVDTGTDAGSGTDSARTQQSMAPQVARQSLDCIVRVARAARIMVVDRGSYEGTPAVVAVVGPPTRALAVNCADQPAEVLMDVALP